jgi:RimJ/RimL family protein N-acetyltransferase
MADSFHVRHAEISDSEGIARVHTRSWQSAYRGLLPDEWLDALRWEDRKVRWDAILASGNKNHVYVATTVQKEIIGFASSGPSRDEDIDQEEVHELYAIYLTPEYWGKGIGKALLNAIMKDVPKTAKRLELWVLEDNASGRRFYESKGFTLDGATKLAEIDGYQLEEVRYRIQLPVELEEQS